MLAGRRGLLRVLLLILPLALVSCCAGADDYSGLPEAGDWVVTDRQVVEDVTKLWIGNITVKSGGDLTLSNTVFIFNSTNTSHKGIFVEEGGKISMVGVRLTAVNKSEGFLFLANGSVEIRRSRLEGLFATTQVLAWVYGFTVRSDNPLVEDSIFSENRGFGPRFIGCSDVVFRNNIVVESSTGILMEESSGVIENCIFYNNTDRQIVIRGCDGVQFTNNTVNLSGMGGLVITRSKNVQTSGNTYTGDLYVVYVSNGSKVTMFGEMIDGSQIQLESRENSQVTLTDSTLDLAKIRAVSGGRVDLVRTVRLLVTKGGDPVPDAIVRIYDQEKLLVAEGETDQEGTYETLLPRATVTQPLSGQSAPVLKEYGDYRFRAFKGIYSASGSADVAANPNIELSMGLPWLYIGIAAAVLVIVILIVIAPPGGARKARKRK